jgi:hypothetical protein
MADAATMRAWLNENDRPQSERGRISDDDRGFYEQANGPDEQDAEPGASPPDGGEGEPVAGAQIPPEDRPARPRARRPSAATRADRAFGRLLDGGGRKSKAKGKTGRHAAPPRVGLEKFVTRSYSMLGRMALPVSPPMSRCLTAQAPMAGVMLEDIARGTVADRILQPVARAEDKLDKAFALIAPPLIVLGLDMASQLPPDQAMMRTALLMPMLRESLRVGLEISEQYADAITARVERESVYDQQIDKIIAAIFGMPAAQAEPPEAGPAGEQAGPYENPYPTGPFAATPA